MPSSCLSGLGEVKLHWEWMSVNIFLPSNTCPDYLYAPGLSLCSAYSRWPDPNTRLTSLLWRFESPQGTRVNQRRAMAATAGCSSRIRLTREKVNEGRYGTHEYLNEHCECSLHTFIKSIGLFKDNLNDVTQKIGSIAPQRAEYLHYLPAVQLAEDTHFISLVVLLEVSSYQPYSIWLDWKLTHFPLHRRPWCKN